MPIDVHRHYCFGMGINFFFNFFNIHTKSLFFAINKNRFCSGKYYCIH